MGGDQEEEEDEDADEDATGAAAWDARYLRPADCLANRADALTTVGMEGDAMLEMMAARLMMMAGGKRTRQHTKTTFGPRLLRPPAFRSDAGLDGSHVLSGPPLGIDLGLTLSRSCNPPLHPIHHHPEPHRRLATAATTLHRDLNHRCLILSIPRAKWPAQYQERREQVAPPHHPVAAAAA